MNKSSELLNFTPQYEENENIEDLLKKSILEKNHRTVIVVMNEQQNQIQGMFFPIDLVTMEREYDLVPGEFMGMMKDVYGVPSDYHLYMGHLSIDESMNLFVHTSSDELARRYDDDQMTEWLHNYLHGELSITPLQLPDSE